jgi:hypothetical protein
MTDKDDRIAKDDKSKKYKFKSKEDKEIIKQKVQQLKKQREENKKREQALKDQKYQKGQQMMKNLHYKLLQEKGQGPIEASIPAYQAHNSSQIYDVSQSQPATKPPGRGPQYNLASEKKKLPTKLTIDNLVNLRYDDVASGPDGFNPADILDDDSDSDDTILKQYKNQPAAGVNESLSSVVLNQPPQPARNKGKTMRTMEADVSQPQITNMKGKHKARALNNSIAGQGNMPMSKAKGAKIGAHTNNASQKNLLVTNKKGSVPRTKKGMMTDDEKIYKRKLPTGRNKASNLPKGIHKSASKGHYDPYQSDGANMRYQNNVPKTVKKSSKKMGLNSITVDKSYQQKNPKMFANKNASQNPMANRRHKGNISMEMYSQADKMESKTKRHQEERLQNTLKMQDQNMKRGIGIAHKNRRL